MLEFFGRLSNVHSKKNPMPLRASHPSAAHQINPEAKRALNSTTTLKCYIANSHTRPSGAPMSSSPVGHQSAQMPPTHGEIHPVGNDASAYDIQGLLLLPWMSFDTFEFHFHHVWSCPA